MKNNITSLKKKVTKLSQDAPLVTSGTPPSEAAAPESSPRTMRLRAFFDALTGGSASKARVIFIYLLSLILRNKISWMLMLFSLLLILVPIFLISDKTPREDLILNSALILGIPFIAPLVFHAVVAFIIFGKTKTNNVDFYLYIQGEKKWKVVVLKQLASLVLSMHTLLIPALFALVLHLKGVDAATNLQTTSTVFMWLIFINVAWCLIFTTITFLLKPLVAIIVSLGSTFVLIIGALVPIIISRPTSVPSYNFNQQNANYLKVYDLDASGNLVKKQAALLLNPALPKTSPNFNASTPFYTYSPFNALFGLAPLQAPLAFNLTPDEIEQLTFSSNSFSWIYPRQSLGAVSGFSNNQQLYYPLGAKAFFDYNLQTQAYDEFYAEISRNELVNISAEQAAYYDAFLRKLQSATIYSTLNLTDKERLFLQDLTGILNNGLAYDFFNNFGILEPHMVDIGDYILTKGFTPSFFNLLIYIWTSGDFKNNIINLEYLVPRTTIESLHPDIATFNIYEAPRPSDLAFIKNTFFHLQLSSDQSRIVAVQVLNRNNLYTNINFQTLFGQAVANVTTPAAFNAWIDNNATVNNLLQIIETIRQSIPAGSPPPYAVSFRSNVPNPYALDAAVAWDYQVKTDVALTVIYFVLLLTCGGLLELAVLRRVAKKDIIL